MTAPRPSGAYRFSRILATTDRGWESFEDLDAMPAVLRATCVKTLEGRQSAVVLIADRNGAASFGRAAAGQPAEVPDPKSAARSRSRLIRSAVQTAAFVAAVVALLLIAFWR